MEHISREGIKEINLKLLTSIDSVCRENNLRYTLAYGTLLGAIRHQGFIPWDDDIDILMPRPDYDLFVAYCAQHNLGFSVANSDLCGEKYKKYFTKVYEPNTIIVEKNSRINEMGLGVSIDVFPIEGLGDSYEQARKRFAKQKFNLCVITASNWIKYDYNSKKGVLYNAARLVFYSVARFVKSDRLIKRVQSFYCNIDYEKSAFVGCVCTPYREREIFRKSIFENMIEVNFEGRKFQAISMYDAFLTQIYGDYMELPPVENRVCPHDSEVFSKQKT